MSIDVRMLTEKLLEKLSTKKVKASLNDAAKLFFSEKTILITGAGGSIGSELCQLLVRSTDSAAIICVDQSEINLFNLENMLVSSGARSHFYLGDISQHEVFREIFETHKVDVCIHAAAYKHVTVAERNPAAVILNNLRSMKMCLEACQKYNVPRFTLLSTDKATEANSVMGKSKRICEKMVDASKIGGNRFYRSFRCGNVLGSSGSVLHQFLRQIENEGTVIITDPEVERFFVHPHDIATHILNATAEDADFDIAVPEMGKPIKIVDLAKELLIELGIDAQISFSALQCGEKLSERLFSEKEEVNKSLRNGIYFLDSLAHVDTNYLNKVEGFIHKVSGMSNDNVKQFLNEFLIDNDGFLPVLPAVISSEATYSIIKTISSSNLGPTHDSVTQFEDSIKRLTGSPYVIATSSGSAALHIACLLAAESSNKYLVSSTFSFAASIFPAMHVGYHPILVDVNSDDWHIDLNKLEHALKKNPSGSLVIVPHIYGGAANSSVIRSLCDRYSAIMIEDAAEAVGVTLNGQHVGTFGDYGIFSFNSNKLITTCGGGALLLRDKRSADRARQLTAQGKIGAPYYLHERLGFNYGLSAISASIGLAELGNLPKYVQDRRKVNDLFVRELKAKGLGIEFINHRSDCLPNFWTTAVKLGTTQIEAVRAQLSKVGIETRRLWYPLHLQPAITNFVTHSGSCRVSEDLFMKGLILPSGKNLSEMDVARVARELASALEKVEADESLLLHSA